MLGNFDTVYMQGTQVKPTPKQETAVVSGPDKERHDYLNRLYKWRRNRRSEN